MLFQVTSVDLQEINRVLRLIQEGRAQGAVSKVAASFTPSATVSVTSGPGGMAGTSTPPSGTVTPSNIDATGATNNQVLTVVGGIGAWANPAVSSVFSRTGAVTAQSGDYTVAQVTGAAPLASPALTGTPTAPTASQNTNTTQLATTAFTIAVVGTRRKVDIGSLITIPSDRCVVVADYFLVEGDITFQDSTMMVLG